MYQLKYASFAHLFFVIVVVPLVLQTSQAAPPEGYAFQPLARALQQSEQENKPVFLYFGRYGCSTCRKMHEEVFTDQGLQRQLSTQFALAYVDTESGKRIRLPNGERTTEMQFASRSRILGTPTFVYYSKERKPLLKRAGFHSIDQLKSINRYVSEGHYQSTSLKEFLAGR